MDSCNRSGNDSLSPDLPLIQSSLVWPSLQLSPSDCFVHSINHQLQYLEEPTVKHCLQVRDEQKKTDGREIDPLIELEHDQVEKQCSSVSRNKEPSRRAGRGERSSSFAKKEKKKKQNKMRGSLEVKESPGVFFF